MNALAKESSPKPDPELFDPLSLDLLASLESERPRLLAWLSRWLGSRDEAEDVLQEAMIAVWQNESCLAGSDSYRAWLKRAAHNGAVDAIRRRGARRHREREWTLLQVAERVPTETPSVSTAALTEAISVLPLSTRSLLVSVELKGTSIAEAARREGATSNSIRVRLHRARRQLLQSLRPKAVSASAPSKASRAAESPGNSGKTFPRPCNECGIVASSGC